MAEHSELGCDNVVIDKLCLVLRSCTYTTSQAAHNLVDNARLQLDVLEMTVCFANAFITA